MCGLFALFNEYISYKKKIYMGEKISHRGPDDSKYVKVKDSFMAFYRLSIIGLDGESNQPFNINGIYLICNGEIYNYASLILMHDINMTTKSDCEVIIHLYLKYGIFKTINMLDGEFSFILYDSNKDIVYAGRDPFGVRPLFYGNSSEYLIGFASEAKSLDNPVPFKPGTYQCVDLLTDCIHNPINYYTYPSKYISDCSMTVKNNIHEMLLKAVNKRLMSDPISPRPIGVLLSGGLDSSLVLSITAKYYKHPIHCFSIGLSNSVDVQAAKEVVDFLKNQKEYDINHHIITYTVEEGFDVLEDVIKAIESYDITTIRASIPQYLMAKYISEKTDIRVILSGEGSDELFAGYKYNYSCPSSEELQRDAIRLIKELYMYDNLRTDRTTAKFGLEVRVPFLDKELVSYVLSTYPQYRMPTTIEKLILRNAFNTENEKFLPDKILFRKKEAFSDAVSSKEISWYKSLATLIDSKINDDDLVNAHLKYPVNTPETKEALYYRNIFSNYYNDNLIDHYWLPKWQKEKIVDPSATILNIV